MAWLRRMWMLRNAWIILLTPLLLMPLLLAGTRQHSAGFCLILMAVYWATEAFPIAVTALLPVLLFPITGLMTGKDVSMTYINDSSMLFVGGLIMAVAVEEWNIHKRIALKILMVMGTEPNKLMLGMMLPSWFLSMWTSNIATVAMMCPIADALLKELEKGEREPTTHLVSSDEHPLQVHSDKHLDLCEADMDTELVVHSTDGAEASLRGDKVGPSKEHLQLAKAMTISIAYAANIGGTTTITGCASNIILKGLADEIFEEKGLTSGITFTSWLVLGFPVSLLLFISLFLWLTLYFRGCSCFKKRSESSEGVKNFIIREYKALGPVTYVTDSAAPTLVAALLFLIPANLPQFFSSKNPPQTVKPLITWRVVHEKVSWGLFLLFGGGFALAQACKVSGLSETIREALTSFQDLPVWLTSLLVALMTSFITEVVTNTATCTLVLPIIAQLALGIGVNPLYLMIPTAVATSYAYMLPVATPPNAMVYVLGYFSISELMKCGFVMNLISVLVLTLGVNTWGAEFYNLRNLPAAFTQQMTDTTTIPALNITLNSGT